MTHFTRHLTLLAALALLVSACGDTAGTTTTSGTGSAAVATTEGSVAESTTTSTAPATETTTSSPPETTTGAPADPGEAAERAAAKTAAASEVLPDDWTATVSAEVPDEDAGVDDIYGMCTDPGDFDLLMLDDVTVAISTLQADGPSATGSFFPAGSASIEARIFDSAATAEEAFGVLEKVVGSEEGRQCMADEFFALMAGQLPGDTDVNFSVEELSVPGADVGARISLGMSVEGVDFQIQIDLAAARDGDCTVYGSFLSFGDLFDEGIRDAMFRAAIDAA